MPSTPASSNPASLVTIGAGQAAVTAVRTLRRRGHDGHIVVLSDEPHEPYQRPPLSKEYLRGDADLADVTILDAAWCAAHDVELRLGTRAERVDAAAGGVRLAGGGEVAADAVLVATGVRPRRLPGIDGERVVHLRGLDDADRLRALLPEAERVAVIGGGLIGSEVAASARDLGVDVTCLEAAPLPMLDRLGPDMARAYVELHRDNGVDVRTGQQVRSVTETGSGVVVRTAAGEQVEADLLVVAVGAVTDDALAHASGLAVDPVAGGVLVGADGRTSVERVYAAGDAASRFDPLTGRHLRCEHLDAAGRQGSAVAGALLGLPAAAEEPAWFWSDQYEIGLQFVGTPVPGATVVVRGAVEERDFIAFYLADGRVHAAFAMDRGGDVPAARQLVALGRPVQQAALADEDTDLFDLLDDTVTA